jgi:hypothetical protein
LAAITVAAKNFLSFSWFEWKFCNANSAFSAFPIALIHFSLKIPSGTTASASPFAHSFSMAIAAIDWQVAGRFKWQLGNLGSALGAFPISLNHFPRRIVSFSKHYDMILRNDLF